MIIKEVLFRTESSVEVNLLTGTMLISRSGKIVYCKFDLTTKKEIKSGDKIAHIFQIFADYTASENACPPYAYLLLL